MKIDQEVLMWLFGAAISISGFILGLLFKGQRESDKRLNEMSDRLSRMETKIGPFWDALASKASKILHSPHFADTIDPLLERYDRGEMDKQGACGLIVHLREIENGHHHEKGERCAAALMILALANKFDMRIIDGHVQL